MMRVDSVMISTSPESFAQTLFGCRGSRTMGFENSTKSGEPENGLGAGEKCSQF